ncbi:MAG: hypothetical protein IJ865_10605 [Clostridia bacterium]|nr:hypothetical protein [Clostridia bacterium]
MAETEEIIHHRLSLLRDAGCVITRFHWQQSDAVYDWCDRHGLMVQEEIPFWGKQPEGDPEALLPIIESQLTETLRDHVNHPSICSWGVGNELSAQREDVQAYIRKAVAFCHLLDPLRLANYVTNTAWQNPATDGAKDGDVMMINDYIGTWHQGYDPEEAWSTLVASHPGRAFLPAEFGLCEPAFPGGDAARERVFLEKLGQYRRIPEIIGTIYFCLNDYRTHMGEEGEGLMRRRVHGSTDLLGNPKPSYFTVRREYTPFVIQSDENEGKLLCVRGDIPCYMLRGYTVKVGRSITPIPDLRPGETWLLPERCRLKPFRILRPDGSTVYES